MYQQIQLYHQRVDGAIDTILIKTAVLVVQTAHIQVLQYEEMVLLVNVQSVAGGVAAVTVTTAVLVILLHILEMQT